MGRSKGQAPHRRYPQSCPGGEAIEAVARGIHPQPRDVDQSGEVGRRARADANYAQGYDDLLSLRQGDHGVVGRHPRQALNREQILDAVWGYSSHVENVSTVNVYIRRLRTKIELNPSRPQFILTVPGIGYRLVA